MFFKRAAVGGGAALLGGAASYGAVRVSLELTFRMQDRNRTIIYRSK
ncbi:MAG: hypothetical protein GY896_15810 [Gammaproteobacteria bacterium]|nr:hypothetical protein [Gammaproteobacteria bacterium]